MVTGDVTDGTGAVENAPAEPVAPDGDHESGEFHAGDFVVDHDIAPSEEEQPTTLS